MSTSNSHNLPGERRFAREHLLASGQLKLECADAMAAEIDGAGMTILQALCRGGKLLVCGNGGSAADAQHLASELVGRFLQHRRALPAIALTTDVSALTAISNDYGYTQVFARQVEAHAAPGDVLVAISTSGNSESVCEAARAATRLGCLVIALTGSTGGLLAPLATQALCVPSQKTELIQEVHESILHAWGALIENHYLGAGQEDTP